MFVVGNFCLLTGGVGVGYVWVVDVMGVSIGGNGGESTRKGVNYETGVVWKLRRRKNCGGDD